MDFIKNAVSSAKGDSSSKSDSSSGERKEDYVDKAFDAAAKKAGYNVSPETSEKITDSSREAFEKATGKHVPDKVSN